MDPYRLSRIDEEGDQLSVVVDTDDSFPPPPISPGGSIAHHPPKPHGGVNGNTHTIPGPMNSLVRQEPYIDQRIKDYKDIRSKQQQNQNAELIYDKVIVKAAEDYKMHQAKTKEALKYFSDKYDSLGKVKPTISGPMMEPGVKPGSPNAGGIITREELPTPNYTPPSSTEGPGLTPEFTPTPPNLPTPQPTPASDMPMASFTPPPEAHSMEPQFNNLHISRQSRSQENILSRTDSYERRSEGLNHNSSRSYGNLHNEGLNNTTLTELDVAQVEMFYRSHKTEVFACRCMANLYFGALNCNPSSPIIRIDTGLITQWNPVRGGIPVLVLDSGESRRKRKLHVILAERGTGFTLWKDKVNHLTLYEATHQHFHTMHLSSDHTKVAGFSFDDSVAAAEFMLKMKSFTSDPDDEILNLSGKAKKKEKEKKKKFKVPSKADISSPCCFTHLTKLDRGGDGFGPVVPPNPARASIVSSEGTSSNRSSTVSNTSTLVGSPRSSVVSSQS